jgi:hypothetical protein
MTPPARIQSYLRKLASATQGFNESSETLYMVVMSDAENRQKFRDSEIKDTDQNGLREFVDGWGQPIAWCRWPSGFVSEVQPYDLSAHDAKFYAAKSHDAFDTQGVDEYAYHQLPLIYSAGPDGRYELWRGATGTFGFDSSSDIFNITTPSSSPQLLGTWYDFDGDGQNGSLDNITNHAIGAR